MYVLIENNSLFLTYTEIVFCDKLAPFKQIRKSYKGKNALEHKTEN